MDRNRWCLMGCLIAFALLALLCGCGQNSDDPVLFQDNFGNPRSGWGEDHRDTFDRGYQDGEYYVDLQEPDWFAWAHPGEAFDDVSIEVDVRLASGSPEGHFGVLCRHVDLNNFYYFAISADGYYAIFRRMGGGDMEILSGDRTRMTRSASINTGEQDNHLVAVCQGEELSFYVNGELLETVTDDAHAEGDVGIGAGSGTEGDVRVHFDNFVATRP